MRRYEGLASVNINGMMQGSSIHQESDLSGLHAGGRESTLFYFLWNLPPIRKLSFGTYIYRHTGLLFFPKCD
jgi:hypothetical protein